MATTTGGEEQMTSPRDESSNLVQRIVQWLRAGYPEGVPQQDYVALLGILRRSLTESELGSVVAELTDEAAAGQQIMTRALLEQRIQDVVKGPIDEGDVVRVSSRLASAGWPLASPVHGGPPRSRLTTAAPGWLGGSSTGSGRGTPRGSPSTTTCPWSRCCVADSPTTSCDR